MNLKQLCTAAELFCPPEAEDVEISSLATDSRRVVAGGLFICIRGLHTDGHSYIESAVKNGAICVLVDRYAVLSPVSSVIYLRCGDCRATCARLYHAWYGCPGDRLRIIGVTGTNGKTSVTQMLRAILERSLHRCGLIGTIGCESVGRPLEVSSSDETANMTTPDPEQLYAALAQMVKDGVEYVIMEVSSHALALRKLEPLQFEAAIFTNLTPEHLDFHKTMSAYAQAKATLFQKARFSVLNADSPYASYMQRAALGTCLTCSAEDRQSDFYADEIEVGTRGVSYRLRSVCTQLKLSCPIPGEFTVINSMQAAVCALELGCVPAAVQGALVTLQAVCGRMERVRLPGADFTLLIDYAHTPDALEKLLQTATRIKSPNGRLVLLFGCGGDRDRTKRAVMGRIATQFADVVIVTSDNSRSEDPNKIIEEIVSGMDAAYPYAVIPNRKQAIESVVLSAGPGDLILLAGKGHETYEITKAGKVPFDEREVVKAAFLKRSEAESNRMNKKSEGDGTV